MVKEKKVKKFLKGTLFRMELTMHARTCEQKIVTEVFNRIICQTSVIRSHRVTYSQLKLLKSDLNAFWERHDM